MNRASSTGLIQRLLSPNIHKFYILSNRTLLSEAYLCENTWKKRLDSPLLKDIKLDPYFIETDKKFGTKRLVSGLDLDLFANSVDDESQLEELEHLLYRFRRTKRATEIMDSTTYAVVRIFLKCRKYESLFRILNDRENYGIFPDLHSYNILMSTFLKEKLFKEAANVAILMMLQENFKNKISCLLALKSCQAFIEEFSFDSLHEENVNELNEEKESAEDDDEEETLVRVPFIREPWFDDHFDITNPRHLIGKTMYLAGKELKNLLGFSYQLYGLALYEKWEKAISLLQSLVQSNNPVLVNDVVTNVKNLIALVPDDNKVSKESLMDQFNKLFQEMEAKGILLEKNYSVVLNDSLKDMDLLEKEDINSQIKLFSEWEEHRSLAMKKQLAELDKERRLKVIEEKKEYLFWKEKLLFFFENEYKILEEKKKIDDMVASMKEKESTKDTYIPPEITKKPIEKKTIYQRLARVKKI